jgi:hypothetical protein
MASPAIPMPPSPDGTDPTQGGPGAPPTSPAAASPSPAEPSPGLDRNSRDVIDVIQKIRGWAKMFPKWAPHAAAVNDEIQALFPIMMEQQKPAEPMAPPVGA